MGTGLEDRKPNHQVRAGHPHPRSSRPRNGGEFCIGSRACRWRYPIVLIAQVEVGVFLFY